jgi:3-oxoacyl-[acyl-carrier-protein] synthase II
VVVTGIGVVSPNGIGREAFAQACATGRSGISGLQLIDPGKLKTSAAAQVLGFEPESVMEATELRRVPRMIPMALAASREALEQAHIDFAADDIVSLRTVGVAL